MNVLCKKKQIINVFLKKILLFRYTCTFIDQHIHDKFYMWNVSVSDHCCQHCDGVVYKADSVIETVFHQDECETVESSICRILPGAFSFLTRIKGPLKIASIVYCYVFITYFWDFASSLSISSNIWPKNYLQYMKLVNLSKSFCISIFIV